MNCTECRAALLTADRAVLRGEQDGEIAAHLRGCASCRRTSLVLEGGSDLLAEMSASRSVVQVSRRGRRGGRIAVLAGAAAATIAGILLAVPRKPEVAAKPARLTTASGVSLTPAAGQRVIEIPSHDPNVTIVWFSSGGPK